MKRRTFISVIIGTIAGWFLPKSVRAKEPQIGLPLNGWYDLRYQNIKPYLGKPGGISFYLEEKHWYATGGFWTIDQKEHPEIKETTYSMHICCSVSKEFPFDNCEAFAREWLTPCDYILYHGQPMTLWPDEFQIQKYDEVYCLKDGGMLHYRARLIPPGVDPLADSYYRPPHQLKVIWPLTPEQKQKIENDLKQNGYHTISDGRIGEA